MVATTHPVGHRGAAGNGGHVPESRRDRLPPAVKPANEVITDFGAALANPTGPPPTAPPGRSPTGSACEPYRETIELGLSQGRNAMAIWQDLVDACVFSGSYHRKTRSRERCLLEMRKPAVRYTEGPRRPF
jgi:hypothetical protein